MSVVVKAGRLFYVSQGSYSDYFVEAHFLALEDLTTELFQSVVDEIKAEINTPEGIKSEYRTINKNSPKYDKNSEVMSCLIPRLLRRGVIMDIDCIELHKGEYGLHELPGVKI